jgi:hypothetical protein
MHCSVQGGVQRREPKDSKQCTSPPEAVRSTKNEFSFAESQVRERKRGQFLADRHEQCGQRLKHYLMVQIAPQA